MGITRDDLTDEQVKEFKETFSLFDTDLDGCITLEEAAIVMRAVGPNPTESELQAMIEELDYNGSIRAENKIDFEQFLHVAVQKMGEEQDDSDILEAFKVFDKEGYGCISSAELRHIMTQLGEKLSDQQADKFIRDADFEGDGQVNYTVFCEKMQQLVEKMKRKE